MFAPGPPKADALPRPLRLAAEGARRRRRAEPARAARRDRRGRGRAAATPSRCPRSPSAPATRPRRSGRAMLRHAARHPDHDARVALPDPHLAARGRSWRRVETVIVDEIHALVGDQARRAPRALARAAGRSCRRRAAAAHRPLGDAAAARGGRALPRRRRTPGGASGRREPVTDRRRGRQQGLRPRGSRCRSRTCRAGRAPGDTGRPRWRSASGQPGCSAQSIWPAIHPRLLELIRAHRSTILFVNSRRLAERLAAALNELAGRGARARAPRLDRARAAAR